MNWTLQIVEAINTELNQYSAHVSSKALVVQHLAQLLIAGWFAMAVCLLNVQTTFVVCSNWLVFSKGD